MKPSLRRPGRRRATSSAQQAGLSLLEVLIVIVLFSFGLLGLVGLQARATQGSLSAEDNNRAALLANELATLMWANNTVNLPAGQVTQWNARVADSTGQGLPNGVGTVTVTGAVARITVNWRPPQMPATDTRRYVTEVLIP